VFRAKRYPIAIVFTGVLVAALAPQGAQAAPKAAAKYDWLQFAFDPGKSANDAAEATVNLGNASKLKQLFKVSLPDAPDGSPVYLSDVTTPKGVGDLLASVVVAVPSHVTAEAQASLEAFASAMPAENPRAELLARAKD